MRFPEEAVLFLCLPCQDLTLPGSPCQLGEVPPWYCTLRHCLHYFSSWARLLLVFKSFLTHPSGYLLPKTLRHLWSELHHQALRPPGSYPRSPCRSLLLTSAGTLPHPCLHGRSASLSLALWGLICFLGFYILPMETTSKSDSSHLERPRDHRKITGLAFWR